MLRHARMIAEQAWQVLGSSLMPADQLWRVGSLLAAVLVLAAMLVQFRLAPGDPARARLRQGLLLVGFGVFTMALGYGPIAAAVDWYVPLQPGQGTRTNTGASVGWVLTVVGVVILLVGLGAQVLRRIDRTQIRVAFVAVAALVGIGWATRTAADARNWDEASQIQAGILGLIKASVPAPRPGPTFVVFGAPGASGNGMAVFLEDFDLSAALQITMHRPDLTGWPIWGASTVSCGPSGPSTQGGWYGPRSGARYGATYFVDYANGRVLPVPNVSVCKQELGGLHPGPVFEFQ
jgi:hypothetical protein